MDFIQDRNAPRSADGRQYVEIAGLSTETPKPTGNFMMGSKFIEIDTGLTYLYDNTAEAGSEWVQFPPAAES